MRHYEKVYDPETHEYLGLIYQDAYSQWHAENRAVSTRWFQSREYAEAWLSRQVVRRDIP